MNALLALALAAPLGADVSPPLSAVVCFTVALIALVTVGFMLTERRHS
jgi:hypothetical protein